MKKKASEEKLTFSCFSIQATLGSDRVQRKVLAQREYHTTKASKVRAEFSSTSASQPQKKSKITRTSQVLKRCLTIIISKRLIKCIKMQQLSKGLKKQLKMTISQELILTTLSKHHKSQRSKKNRKLESKRTVQ